MSMRRRKWWQRRIQSAEFLESRVVLDGTGVFAVPVAVEIPEHNGADVQLGDMNNDGNLNAVVGMEDHRFIRHFDEHRVKVGIWNHGGGLHSWV